MSLSRDQIIFLKRAQAEAGLSDEDYRDAIAVVSGMADCRSSKDTRLTDEHWDGLLSYFEAIYWHSHSEPGPHVFKEREFWRNRNRKGETSRDRFNEKGLQAEILQVEARLAVLGYGHQYCQAIQNRMRPCSLWAYLAALKRTVASKEKAKGKELEPF